MAKTKYDFIKELLEDKKINQNHRERILELASKEISLEGTLEERVQKIEDLLFKKEGKLKLTEESIFSKNLKKMLNDGEIENNLAAKNLFDTGPNEENLLPRYLNPCHLYNFLFQYNQNKILRTTCHDIDSNELESILEFCKTETYEFKEHLKNIHDAYSNHERTHFAPYQVKALIRGYLTGKDNKDNPIKGWSSKNIKINWNSDELFKWADQNIETPPNLNEDIAGMKEIELLEFSQINSAITATHVQNFTQLVLHYKNLFHIKSGLQSLNEIIKRVNSERNWIEKADIEFDEDRFINNLEHFTDVEKLVQAYNKIMDLVIDQHNLTEKPKVKLSYYQENHKVTFSIHHLNGVYNKTIENTIERLGQTYTALIKNQINGLCNFHLKADFGKHQFAEINLWNGKNRESKHIQAFQGVEHILEFPKTDKL
jgi:hypothetical protein